MSTHLLHVLKTTEEEFREVVRSAASEDDVFAWVRSRATPEKIARWNAWIDGFRLKDLPAENVAFFDLSNPATRDLSRDARVIDALDLEDEATLSA